MQSAALRSVPRESLLLALSDARGRLERFEPFDTRGLAEIARAVRELHITTLAIELELRRRSLEINSPLLTPIGNIVRGSRRLSAVQRTCLVGLQSGDVVVRFVDGYYRIEVGEIGGDRFGRPEIGYWRSRRRKPGQRAISRVIESLLLRGFVELDGYGYVVLSEPGKQVIVKNKRGRKKFVSLSTLPF